jgi:hypothetical protein
VATLKVIMFLMLVEPALSKLVLRFLPTVIVAAGLTLGEDAALG